MPRYLLMSVVCLAALVPCLRCAEQPPSRVPDQATVDAWVKDLDGADPAKRRDSITRIQDAFAVCRLLDGELRNNMRLQGALVLEKEELTRELNRRNEELTGRNSSNLKLQQQISVMGDKDRFDFNKAFAKATEQARKSGNADEKAALLELENRQLKQVVAQYQKEGYEARFAQLRSADQCVEALFKFERSLYEARLQRIGGQQIDLVPSFIGLLHAPDWSVQAKAAHLLGLFDPPALAALPALKDALKDPSGLVRASAAYAIWRIEKSKDVVLPILLELLEKDRFAAGVAAQVLSTMGRQDASIVEPLVRLLQNANAEVVLDAAWVLQAIGPDAKSAVPALEAAAKDQRPVVSEAAKQALQKINEPVPPKKEP